MLRVRFALCHYFNFEEESYKRESHRWFTFQRIMYVFVFLLIFFLLIFAYLRSTAKFPCYQRTYGSFASKIFKSHSTPFPVKCRLALF